MSIGVSCGALFFMKGLDLRIPGPVDNLDGGNLLSTVKLLNGEFYNSIINKTYTFDNEKPDWGEYPTCRFTGFNMFHNDFHLEKTQNELMKRYNNLLEYLEKAKEDKEMFFVLAHNCADVYLTNDDITNIFNSIPEYIQDRLIIVGEQWLESGVDPKNYPDIPTHPQYIVDISILRRFDITSLLKEDFKKWWIKNKKFYEERNNCQYE